MENQVNQQATAVGKVLYTAKTQTIGGREGSSKSDDGRLAVVLSTPGTSQPGTNPEQLFAAGWSACFIGALGLAAKKLGLVLPMDTRVDAEVDLANAVGAFYLQARLKVFLPSLAQEEGQQLVDLAHQTCPYSKAVQGNIAVTTTVFVDKAQEDRYENS